MVDVTKIIKFSSFSRDLVARNYLSRIIRKPAFCICVNKEADQLLKNWAADQRHCFLYIDSTIFQLPKSEISNL